MSYNLSSTQNNKIDFLLIEEKIKELEKNLHDNNITEITEYRKWKRDFEIIYGSEYIDIRLYISFALIYFTGHFFISKYILKSSEFHDTKKNFALCIKELQSNIKIRFKDFDLFNFEYFNPIISLINKNCLSPFPPLTRMLTAYLFKLDIEPVYMFDYLIQTIISSLIRHGSGEFYTMPFLVEKMVDNCYNFGERVLDPCCGSGNFLIEIMKRILSSNKLEKQKILAINNIYGFDINPISIFITKINFLILLKGYSSKVKINLLVADSLFPQQFSSRNKVFIKNSLNSYDLIIGNPPFALIIQTQVS